MKNIAIIISLLLIKFNVSAQNYQKTILAIDITEADLNGEEASNYFSENGNYVTFYQNAKDSIMNLAIVWPNDSSMSYGPLTISPIRTNNELYEGKRTEKSYYKWYYINTYDENKGWATIEFSIVHDENEAFYILRMFIDSDFQIYTYKGYLNDKLTGSTSEVK